MKDLSLDVYIPKWTNPYLIPGSKNWVTLDTDPPTMDEIEDAITRIKNNKAAGPDGIVGEAIKGSMHSSTKILHKLFERIWQTEVFPKDWKEGHIVKLPKKGNQQECGNHRGIMLLSVPGKVFNRIILERLKAALDSTLRNEQAGFRRGRSCTDQIATLRIIVEQSLEWNSSLYVNFVDYEKAFDSVDRESLWKILRHYGVPEKITTIIRKIYHGTSGRVIHSGELTEPFEIKTGVRQGCMLSPFLFLLAIDFIMKRCTGGRNGIQWTLTSQLDDLDYADDIALLSHNYNQMQNKTNILGEISKSLGLRINKNKSKTLRLKTTNTNPITVNQEPIEDVSSFCYLGSTIDIEGGVNEDIKHRIQKARHAFLLLRKVWTNKAIREKTRIKIFNSNVKSVLLYGSETWRTTKATLHRLQTFINRCLRIIVGVHWPDTISNANLYERTNQAPVETELKKRKWRWIGHTLRQPRTNLARHSLRWNPQGKKIKRKTKDNLEKRVGGRDE